MLLIKKMATIHRVAISYIFLCCNIVERTYSTVTAVPHAVTINMLPLPPTVS